MSFKIIDKQKWNRRSQFEHYYSNVPCTYSMTVKLEITKIIKLKKKLYPTMLYAIASIVNNHEELRTSFDEEGNVGIFDVMYPCYTIFHKETETFSNIWTPYNIDFDRFFESYYQDLQQYGTVEKMDAKPDEPRNTFPVSMIPWESFEGFNLNLKKGYDYLSPIFTIGKYYRENDKYYIPLAIQVHHAVCDGYHVCRFISELRNLLQS